MPRILQVCNTDFYLSKFLRPLILELHHRGYEVECLCSGTNTPSEFKTLGIKVHNFDFPQKASVSSFIRSTQKMTEFLKENNFDCINSHNRNASIVARLAAWRAKVPVNLYTAHGFYFHDDQPFIINQLTELFEGLLSKITTHTLSQSHEDTLKMVKHGWIDESKITTIGNGINVEKFSPKSNKSQLCKKLSLTEKFRVVTVGRLVKGKGFRDLIHAFNDFQEGKDVELLFIGGNLKNDIEPEHDSYTDLIKSLGLEDKVKITGLIDNVEEYLGASDVFVLPSYREGVPRALLEAMCMQLPVIATNIRGAREIIRVNSNGLLFTPHNVTLLTELLDEIFSDHCNRKRIGEEGRSTVLKNFNEIQYTKVQANLIDQLLMSPGKGESHAISS